jgi:hypothetical protein
MNHHDMHGHGGPAAGTGHDMHGDGPAAHVMLMLGQENVYLSHLPMFDHSQHAYQVLLKVTLSKAGSDVQAIYANDRRAHPEVTIYTLVPERFVLTDLVAGEPLRSFVARDVVRGHFERQGSTTILQNVQVHVEQVIHFRRFTPLSYLLLGDKGELFAAHHIVKAPDFDQLLSVQVSGQPFTDEELQGGVRVFVPGRVNHIKQRLRAGEVIQGEVRANGTHPPRSVELKVGTEFYLEEGELDLPSNFSPTREELDAGFA